MHSEIKIKDKAKDTRGIKAAPFRKHIRKTLPHTHNSYLELVYLTKGSGEHTIDTHTYEILPPVVYLIAEKQLHFWNIDSEPEGFVLILKKAFVDQYLNYELKHLISQLKYHLRLEIAGGDVKTINTLFELLVSEIDGLDRVGNIVPDLLGALITKILGSCPIKQTPAGGSLFSKFTELLSSATYLFNNVAHYAKLLHTTPQNLNAACKKETGNTASNILANHIISEANRLLMYTRLPISEIAYTLGFKDNSHFSRYFKKKTNATPSALRKSG